MEAMLASALEAATCALVWLASWRCPAALLMHLAGTASAQWWHSATSRQYLHCRGSTSGRPAWMPHPPTQPWTSRATLLASAASTWASSGRSVIAQPPLASPTRPPRCWST
ncbi:hypothetical protein COO60DRAFT_1504812 [Scenedesmus sp. NREL 46B-D3]|nr:hypothetical protein COO60DRAFT_1504812 [Scenedesmus sp. NREL 46B-D3]